MKRQVKVALVTGGSRGIGLAIARSLYQQDYQVVVCSRNKTEIKKAALEIDPSGKRVMGIKVDVSREKDVKRLFRTTIKKFSRVDILINNAGVFWPFGQFEKTYFAQNRTTIEINLIGTMLCCYHAIPHMKKHRWGRIINFSGGGIGGDIALQNAVSYFTSKGAIVYFTECLATELEPFGITVNTVLPGQILTDATKKILKTPENKLGPVLKAAKNKLISTGGQRVEPVLKLINYLLTTKAKNLTGRLLSARWDDLNVLSESANRNLFKIRRIDEKRYTIRG